MVGREHGAVAKSASSRMIMRLAAEFQEDLLHRAASRPSRMRRPVTVEPVKVIMSTSGCVVSVFADVGTER